MLHAEWTKLRTLPSTGWLLLVAAGCTVLLGFAITGSLHLDQCQAPCFEDTTKLTLSGVRLGQVGVVILGVLAVSAEYGTRTIQPTLIAMPRRVTMMVSKLAIVGVLALGAGVFGVAGSLLVGRAVLPGRGYTVAHGYQPLSLGDHLSMRAALGSVVYLGLVALLSSGVAMILRDTAGAVTAVLLLLFGSPIIAAFISDPRWQHRLHRFSPMDAGLAIQATRDIATTTHIGAWAGIGVLAAYAGAAVLGGLILLRLRDA